MSPLNIYRKYVALYPTEMNELSTCMSNRRTTMKDTSLCDVAMMCID